MHAVGEVALWLAVVVCAWTAVTAFSGAGRDARLLASGARGLHAAGGLAVLSVAMLLVAANRDLAGAPAGVAPGLTMRELWANPSARLTLWAAISASFAAILPRLLRGSDRSARVGGQLVAAGVVLVMLLAAAGARYVIAGTVEQDAGAPVVVHSWIGVVARLLVAVGCGSMLVPFVLLGIAERRDIARRWTLAALGVLCAGLALVAWVRYAVAAPASVLDQSGAPAAPIWTTLDALWAVPPLVMASAAYWLSSRARGDDLSRSSPERQAAILLLVLVGAVVAGVIVPPVLDWTHARPIEIGFAILPPLVMLVAIPALLAVLALLVNARQHAGGIGVRDAVAASAGAALLGSGAWLAGVAETRVLSAIILAGASAGMFVDGMLRAASPAARAAWVAQAAALVAAAAVLAGMSHRAQTVDLAPGAPDTIEVRGDRWRLASQGTSQDEAAAWDGIIIAFEVRTPHATRLVTAGERMYRDAHGHEGARVARPGVAHGVAGDLRMVVQAIRDGAARVQVQYHPLVPLAWVAAAITVLALLVAAFAPAQRTAAPATTRPTGTPGRAVEGPSQ